METSIKTNDAALPAISMAGKGGKAAAANATNIITTTSPSPKAGPSRQRKGKGILSEDSTKVERTPVIVNIAKASGLHYACFLAVEIFLSVLAMPSKQLISYMRRVWKIRGIIDSNEIANKRFVIEFSEEGDYEHVTRGGPWRYADDAVLIRGLKEG
jgi:hypothetical protein